MGNSKAEPTDTSLSDSYEIYNLNNIVKYKTCFKNPNRLTCIDPIITNKPKNSKLLLLLNQGYLVFTNVCYINESVS